MTSEWITTGITCSVFIGSGFVAVWRVSWVVSNMVSTLKAEFNALLELKEEELKKEIKRVEDEQNEKRARVYERFDEHKTRTDEAFTKSRIEHDATFVRRDMCGVMHKGTADAVIQMNTRIDSVEKKIEELKDLIIKMGQR